MKKFFLMVLFMIFSWVNNVDGNTRPAKNELPRFNWIQPITIRAYIEKNNQICEEFLKKFKQCNCQPGGCRILVYKQKKVDKFWNVQFEKTINFKPGQRLNIDKIPERALNAKCYTDKTGIAFSFYLFDKTPKRTHNPFSPLVYIIPKGQFTRLGINRTLEPLFSAFYQMVKRDRFKWFK